MELMKVFAVSLEIMKDLSGAQMLPFGRTMKPCCFTSSSSVGFSEDGEILCCASAMVCLTSPYILFYNLYENGVLLILGTTLIFVLHLHIITDHEPIFTFAEEVVSLDALQKGEQHLSGL